MSESFSYQPVKWAEHQLKVKASRFLAEAFPIASEEEVQLHLAEVKKREFTANHHCYAWRMGLDDDEVWRVNDDGEPAGTAGKPIYQVLVGQNITNILVVVTRYFGGTKLGKGGLIRAYGGVVQELLPLVKKEPFIPMSTLECQCSFEHANLVYRLVETFEARIESQDYGESVTIVISLKKDQTDAFAWELHELSHGTIKAHPLNLKS